MVGSVGEQWPHWLSIDGDCGGLSYRKLDGLANYVFRDWLLRTASVLFPFTACISINQLLQFTA